MADKLHDPPPVPVGDTHAATIESVEDSVAEVTTECYLNVALSKHVHGAPEGEVGEAFGADANGLAVIDKGDRGPLDGARDGGGFPVIESLGCGPADETLKMRHAHVSEVGMLNELLVEHRGKCVGIFSPRPTTGLKLH